MTIAMVFPGQGSQSVGMQAALADKYETVRDTYSEASEVLGFDLWQLAQNGPAEQLDETVVTQPAMLTAGVAAWRVWQAAGGTDPAQVAGHSLGEYSALVCAGALEFAEALALVRQRAELMQGAVAAGQGAMAAILGLDDSVVLEVCQQAAAGGVADAVNFNSPGQVVIAGDADAIARAIDLAKEQGARRAILLSVSVPAHSSLMRPAGEKLAEALAGASISSPRFTVINSVNGTKNEDAEKIRQHLSHQVYSPVRWVDTVNAMIGNGATTIIECGPGKVLAGLTRRIDKTVNGKYIDSPESLQAALDIS